MNIVQVVTHYTAHGLPDDAICRLTGLTPVGLARVRDCEPTA